MIGRTNAVSINGEIHGAVISALIDDVDPTAISVVLKLGDVTIASKYFDENGVCTFADIQETGSYTVSATRGSVTKSNTISITSDNIVNKTILSTSFIFILDGATATPVNDVPTWLRTNSTGETLSKGYTTLDQVIRDTTTLNNLMANESAMQYLARSTAFADEGCASETFMTYLGKSPYVDSTVLNSDLWVEAICNSTHFESVLRDKVPTMTSDTVPYGEVKRGSDNNPSFVNGGSAYSAFDGDDSTYAATYGYSSSYLGWLSYTFVNPIKIERFSVINGFYNGTYRCKTFKIQALNNNSWVDLTNNIVLPDNSTKYHYNISKNKGYYNSYRIYIIDSHADPDSSTGVNTLQFYGRYKN